MKRVSNGFVFDTEKSTKLVTLSDCDFGNGGIYKTENGRYFTTCISDDSDEPLRQIEESDIDQIILEWEALDSGTVTVHFEEFEVG